MDEQLMKATLAGKKVSIKRCPECKGTITYTCSHGQYHRLVCFVCRGRGVDVRELRQEG
jgi:hypothetical protein